MQDLLQNEMLQMGGAFLVGVAVGFVIGKYFGHKVKAVDGWERSVLLFIISGIWVLSSLSSILGGGETPTLLHVLMGAVVGFYFEVDILGHFTKKK